MKAGAFRDGVALYLLEVSMFESMLSLFASVCPVFPMILQRTCTIPAASCLFLGRCSHAYCTLLLMNLIEANVTPVAVVQRMLWCRPQLFHLAKAVRV